MKQGPKALVLAIGLALASCSSSETGSKYEGLWYNELTDYWKIDADGNITQFQCSLRDGYVRSDDQIGVLEGDEFHFESRFSEWDASAKIDGNALTLSFEGWTGTYVRHDSMPAACDGDAIEITSVIAGGESMDVTPDEWGRVTYTVNFDYRFTSQDVGYLGAGVNNESVPGAYIGAPSRAVSPIDTIVSSSWEVPLDYELVGTTDWLRLGVSIQSAIDEQALTTFIYASDSYSL